MIICYFLKLPDALLHEIFAYLEKNDRIEFAKSNKSIGVNLIREAREKTTDGYSFFTSKELRDTIFKLINKPYHQINLRFNSKTYEVFKTDSSPSFSFAKVKSSWENYESFATQSEGLVDRVKELTLFLNSVSLEPLRTIVIPHAIERMHLSHFYYVDSILINHMEHLTYVHLLHLSSIIDVSVFRSIREVSFRHCRNIRDISCLTDNQIISISDCYGVKDFSNAFYNTKKISLEVNYATPRLLPFSPHRSYEKLRELKLIGEFHLPTIDINGYTATLPNAPYLHTLVLMKVEFNIILPKTSSLRVLIIRNCLQFLSCENLGNIHKVVLDGLILSSLEGLGANNKIVEIRNCFSILHFHPLRFCDRATIEDSNFSDASSLAGVRDLTFISDRLTKKHQGIHHVILKHTNDYATVSVLQYLSSVRTVSMQFPTSSQARCLLVFCEYSHIERIELREGSLDQVLKTSPKLRHTISEQFHVERVQESDILIRKSNAKPLQKTLLQKMLPWL